MLRHDSYDAQLPALLAHRHADHLQGRVDSLVRARSPTSATAWSSSTRRSTGSPSHVRDGAFGKWLEGARDWSISRNRFWGAPIPVWKQRRPRLPAHRRLRLLDELEADFGVRAHRPAPPVHRRPRAPQPRRPDRQVDDAARARGARLLVRVGLDALRPGRTTRSRTRSGSRRTSRPTSSSSTSPRRAAGSTRCTCCRRRCSTGRRSRTASATASCSTRTAASSPSGCATTPTPRRSSRPSAPTRCAGSCMSSPILRGGDLAHRPRGLGHRRGRAPGAQPHLERLLLLHALRQRRRLPRQVAHRRAPTCSTATSWPRPATLVDAVTERARRLRPRRRLRRGPRVPRRAQQLVHPPLAATGSGRPPTPAATSRGAGQARRLRHALHGAARRSPGSRRRCCRSSPRRSTPASPASESRAPRRLARRRRAARRPRAGRAPWTASATCAPRRCRCARTAACGSACPLARLTVAGRDAAALAPFADLHRRRGQREGGRALRRPRGVRHVRAAAQRPRCSAPSSAATCRRSSAPPRPASGPPATTAPSSWPATPSSGGEFDLALEARDGEATAAVRGNDAVVNLDIEVTDELRAEGIARDLSGAQRPAQGHRPRRVATASTSLRPSSPPRAPPATSSGR